jgi:hypothetical protein
VTTFCEFSEKRNTQSQDLGWDTKCQKNVIHSRKKWKKTTNQHARIPHTAKLGQSNVLMWELNCEDDTLKIFPE